VLTSGAVVRILLNALSGPFPEPEQLRGFVTSSRPAVLGATAARALESRGIRPWLQASVPSLEVLAKEMAERL
jgi:uroporphyrinogen-III synthase